VKFRAYKRDNERGYLVEGLVFNDDEDSSIGFILERINYPSGKSTEFTLGTEANELGMKLFDTLKDIFKKYGKLNEVKKVKMWISRLAGFSFDVSLLASWNVEESKWKDLTKEIEEKIEIS
jgi:superfamily I DNA/RNA helicase